MKIDKLSVIRDNRSDCFSIMGTTSIISFVDYIKEVYADRGGIMGQRDALKTSSAIKIRKRMIKDIASGTVLPPLVIGLLLPSEKFDIITETIETGKELSIGVFHDIIKDIDKENISLIDGMQRTTAILEAISTSNEILKNTIRVEFWVVKNLNNLLYRMLILNTGQVPWNVRRQLEVLYSSIKKRISDSIPEATIYSIDDEKRRSASSQYQGNAVIELFLVFGSRKEKIELKERIAEEFTRIDFIETTEKNDLMEFFIRCFSMLNKLDSVFGSARKEIEEDENRVKFINGMDLFSSQPARIGFMVALALKIIGRPGVDKDAEDQKNSLNQISTSFQLFIDKLRSLSNSELLDFMSFEVLNEIIDKPSTKVGDFERTFFKEAFTSLIEQHFEVNNLESCWRAY